MGDIPKATTPRTQFTQVHLLDLCHFLVYKMRQSKDGSMSDVNRKSNGDHRLCLRNQAWAQLPCCHRQSQPIAVGLEKPWRLHPPDILSMVLDSLV